MRLMYIFIICHIRGFCNPKYRDNTSPHQGGKRGHPPPLGASAPPKVEEINEQAHRYTNKPKG